MFGSDEPVPMMIEAVVRLVLLVVRSVFRLVRFAIRRPRVASAAGSLLVLDRYAGHVAVLAVLVALVVGLVVWRVAWPESYRGQVRPRLTRVWLSMTYPGKWRRIAPRVGLVVHDHTGANKPWVYGGLGDVRVTPAGIVRSAGGDPDRAHPRRLRPQGRRAGRRVRGPRSPSRARRGRGRCGSSCTAPTSSQPRLRPLPVGPEPEVNLAGVPVGRHEDGTEWRFSLWQTHVLIAGATGAGKGSILWSLLRGLVARPSMPGGCRCGRSTPRAAWNCAPGNGCSPGSRTAPRRRCATCSKTSSPSWTTRAKQLAHLGIRKHQPSPDSPHLLAVIDELATLTAFAERDVVRRIDKALGLLLTKGRAVGITVLAAVQDPGKDVVGWRDLFPTRVAMRLDNPIQVDMVLGEGARDMGATADHINEQTPGVAFVRVEGTRAIRRVRASYLTDDDIHALAGSVTASPALTAPRAPKPVDPLDSWPRQAPPSPAPEPTPDAAAKPRKPRTPRKPRNRDGSQVA